ncbi:alpha/beta hydrolase [Enterococcus sp. LJL120]
MKLGLPKPLFSPKDSRAVILLHAYSGSSNDVRMLSRFLENADYTVYSPIFSGHATLDPLDILNQSVAAWEEDTRKALEFLKSKGYQEIAIFGLSMGGVFATRALEWSDESIVGGGFFCSPIFPVKTTIPENFLVYAENVLRRAGLSSSERNQKLTEYQPLINQQLQAIEEMSQVAASELDKIRQPLFMAQAGQDEMIDATGVFKTAAALTDKRFELQWYPESGHVITVGPDRRKLEVDVLNFINKLSWKEE